MASSTSGSTAPSLTCTCWSPPCRPVRIRTRACRGSTHRSAATGSSRRSSASGCVRTWRGACSTISRRRRRPPSISSRMPSPARSSTKPAPARWPRSRKCPTASTTAASMPRRCSSCWPARTTSEPATLTAIEAIWPNLLAALDWIDKYGDLDGDGLVEYQRKTPRGLLHQGWKDSDDAICHADGSPAEGPIALCEVQGYVFAAWEAGARLAEALGQTRRRRVRSRPRPSTCAGNSSSSFWLRGPRHVRPRP